jgi:hypothetical protein
MWRLSRTVSAIAIVVFVGASDLSGSWEVDVRFDDPAVEGGQVDCAIKQDGEQLTGTCSDGTARLTGDVRGRDIRWRIGSHDTSTASGHTFTGTVDESGTRIKGRFSAGGKDGTFSALKSK